MSIKTKYIRFLAAIYYGLYKALYYFTYCLAVPIGGFFNIIKSGIAHIYKKQNTNQCIDFRTHIKNHTVMRLYNYYHIDKLLMGSIIWLIIDVICLTFAVFGLRIGLNIVISIIMLLIVFTLIFIHSRYLYPEDFFRRSIPVYDKLPRKKRILLTLGSAILTLVIFAGSMILVCYSFLMADYFRKLWGWNI